MPEEQPTYETPEPPSYLGMLGLRTVVYHVADLEKAKLNGASLQRVDLHGTKLEGAVLLGVNLLSARGLTIKNICKAKNLHNAKMDPLLNQQVIAKCPHLLEKLQAAKDDKLIEKKSNSGDLLSSPSFKDNIGTQ